MLNLSVCDRKLKSFVCINQLANLSVSKESVFSSEDIHTLQRLLQCLQLFHIILIILILLTFRIDRDEVGNFEHLSRAFIITFMVTGHNALKLVNRLVLQEFILDEKAVVLVLVMVVLQQGVVDVIVVVLQHGACAV